MPHFMQKTADLHASRFSISYLLSAWQYRLLRNYAGVQKASADQKTMPENSVHAYLVNA
jgi:hypothetical protein